MKVLVTGAAGFIGSHLSERLLQEGHEVVGVDCFIDYYPRPVKENNLSVALKNPGYRFRELSLARDDISDLLDDIDAVYHQAAQAGVRASWGKDFSIYVENNIVATQRLLEAAKFKKLKRFIYASSSSVYGDVKVLPATEELMPQPVSPYGVSKLAAEHLVYLYWKNFGLPTVSLRYFTVYGPRQRPDMAFHKFLKAMIKGEPIPIYGDGDQSRDFTFIADAVAANLSTLSSDCVGQVFNIGGGSRVTVREVIQIMEKVSGRSAILHHETVQKGDVGHTSADISKAQETLGYSPKFSLEEGIRQEYQWLMGLTP